MKSYITIQGDTWDMIAKKVYGNEKCLDILMQSNFPLLDYLVFPAGIEVLIPDKLPDRQENLPIWRR